MWEHLLNDGRLEWQHGTFIPSCSKTPIRVEKISRFFL
jgi:hypothetical protein